MNRIHNITNYISERNKPTIEIEKFSGVVYEGDEDNNVRNETIGYGWDIKQQGLAQTNKVFKDLGFNGLSISKVGSDYKESRPMTESEAIKLLNYTFDKLEQEANKDSRLNLDHYLGVASKERVALMDMLYNGGTGLVPKNGGLHSAIKSDNRAEAWFEIRYGSNGDGLDGLANRRIAESDMFGLYDAGMLTSQDALEVVKMYNNHKMTIDNYEAKYQSTIIGVESFIGIKNDAYTEVGDARVKVLNDYAKINGVIQNIDGDIIIGKGVVNTYAYQETGSKNDNLNGTSKNDLIFGGAGNDSIKGGDGNDIIYGDAGNDTLTGGIGKDTLTGGDGADKFVIDVVNVLGEEDSITDFNHGVDKIILNGISFDAQNFKDVTTGDQARDSNDYILYNKSTGNLYYDVDGWDYGHGDNNVGAKLIAHFDNNSTLAYSDFAVI